MYELVAVLAFKRKGGVGHRLTAVCKQSLYPNRRLSKEKARSHWWLVGGLSLLLLLQSVLLESMERCITTSTAHDQRNHLLTLEHIEIARKA